MILAPNRRQLLNGSKYLFLLAFIASFLGACDALRPAQGQQPPASPRSAPAASTAEGRYFEEIRGTKVYDPVKRQWVSVSSGAREKMDTLNWKVVQNSYQTLTSFPKQFIPQAIPEIPKPNLVSPSTSTFDFARVEKKDQYQIVVALPFLAGVSEENNPNAEGSVSRWAVNFYGGMKLAGEELAEEGLNLRVEAFDTKADEKVMESLVKNPAFSRSDVIIGPYRRDNIRIAAEFARLGQKVLVSPYSAVSNMVDNNPNFIQVNPSLESHCRALMKHARRDFDPEDILILTRDNPAEKTCVEYLQKANLEMTGAPDALPVKEHIFPTATYGGINVAPLIRGKDQVALIIPSWAEPNFVFFLLRRILEARLEGQTIVVYGMPQWMEFENFEYEFFEKLNVRVSSNAYLDPLSPEVRNFRQRYFDTYGTVPDLAAFQGYDLFLYLGRMLKEYGRFFQFFLDVNPAQQLHTPYEFQAIPFPGASADDRMNQIARFENRYVNILEFRDFQFQLLR
ncbi:MAG: amino acid ABC transporter substrate-binding protein [Haliscomenobacter sp.]|nr:amino acid ABC transporter substrate-binding protein [Haliscomenobacter sp.]